MKRAEILLLFFKINAAVDFATFDFRKSILDFL